MENSLRRGLVVRLVAAILVLMVLDAFACYYTAAHFSNVVYDRWLIDSARSLSTAIKVRDGVVTFTMPHEARDIFQFDEVDKTYFRVSTPLGLIAGEPALPEAMPMQVGENRLMDTQVDGVPARLVAVALLPTAAPVRVLIEVAETLNKRVRLRSEILLAMVAPQLALLATAIVLASVGISRGLKPLTDLGAQLEARGHHNLTHIPEHGLPREVRTLVWKINDLLSRLEHAMTIQKRFVADAAHQLRTPLTAVVLHADRADHAIQSGNLADGGHALQMLQHAAQRATRLSQQLLTLARAEPDAVLAADFKPTSLTALARSVGEEWVPRALAQESDFGLVLPDADVTVVANASLVRELISNLIDNALRYAGPGSRITLSVETSPAPSVAVEDNGPGVPEKERERIFERFYRISQSEVPGCGLGLAIAREIAKLHGGTVTVQSPQGRQGARFVISFGSAGVISN